MGPPKKIANILRSLLVLTLIIVCCCEPQGSYYDRFGYSRSPADIRRSYAPNNRLPSNNNHLSSNNNLFSSNNNRLPAINNNYNRYNTYRTPSATTTSNSYNSYRSPSAASTTSYSSYNRLRTTSSTIADRYSSKRYPSQDTKASSSSLSSSSNTASNADVENAKFAGVSNQEADDKPESGKTLLHIKRKYHRLRPYRNRNRCFPYGRDAVAAQKDVRRDGVTPPPQEQGRFLWDLNVYNVYPQGGPLYSPIPGCGGLGGGGLGLGGGGLGLGGGGIFGDYIGGGNYGGYGGLGGGGGGLLSDPIAPAYQATTPLNNFLNLFAPGILQNALAATVPPLPPPQQDPVAASDDELSDLQNDPAVDPNYRPAPPPPPRRRPNRVYYDSAGAPAITPAQLVGGVATTVNGIIQQLTGNVQPVYQSSYRRSSYG